MSDNNNNDKYTPFEGNDRPNSKYIDPSISFSKASDQPYVRTTKVGSEDVETIEVKHEQCHRGEGLTEDGKIVVYGGGCPYAGKVAIAKYRITDSKQMIRDRTQGGYYCPDCMFEMENRYSSLKYLIKHERNSNSR